jgi:hypothetical protein
MGLTGHSGSFGACLVRHDYPDNYQFTDAAIYRRGSILATVHRSYQDDCGVRERIKQALSNFIIR